MKYEITKRIGSVVIAIVLFLVTWTSVFAIHDNKKMGKRDCASKYFSVNLKTKEWRKYTSHEQMLKACDISSSMTKEMTTDELFNVIMEYPLLCDIFIYDSVENGIQNVRKQFRPLDELFQRKDLPQVLLNKYKQQRIRDDIGENQQPFKKISQTIILETLLGKKTVYNSLSNEEKKSLEIEVINKQAEKLSTKMYHGTPSAKGLLSIFQKYNSSNTLDMCKASHKYVKTPKGSRVRVESFPYAGNKWSKRVTAQLKLAYPKATVLANADNRYNCHSYAWYKRSSSNRYWMNNPKKYVSDGSYRYVNKKVNKKNKIVVYGKWIHSGVVDTSGGMVRSKWGQGPLMWHHWMYSPYSGGVKTYEKQ